VIENNRSPERTEQKIDDSEHKGKSIKVGTALKEELKVSHVEAEPAKGIKPYSPKKAKAARSPARQAGSSPVK